MDLPGVPSTLWPPLLAAAAPHRLALVGGAVRDWLLHHQHRDPWRGLVDLDLVIEDAAAARGQGAAARPDPISPAGRLVEQLTRGGATVTVRQATTHGQFGTVEVEVEVVPSPSGGIPAHPPIRLLLDVASARAETYPRPADNPVVSFGGLEDDLSRRDLTINAMALDLATGVLVDPHGGQADLAARTLRFLHPGSLRDDPTRLLRAARYGARLGFQLAAESRAQARATVAAWPWPWRLGDDPGQAPPALGTRLRRELALLLEHHQWRLALTRLQEWEGLALLDRQLQTDRRWPLRLHWATRLGLPREVALIAAAADPIALAERLQVPHRQHQLLRQLAELRRRLDAAEPSAGRRAPATAWQWCQVLEAPGLSPSAVALALACGLGPRRPLLRWLLRWRHLGPECGAREWIAAGVPPGPELGERLRRSRQGRLGRERI